MTTAAIEVRIPTILRPYTKDAKVVSADGADLKSVISDLDRQFKKLKGVNSGLLRVLL